MIEKMGVAVGMFGQISLNYIHYTSNVVSNNMVTITSGQGRICIALLKAGAWVNMPNY